MRNDAQKHNFAWGPPEWLTHHQSGRLGHKYIQFTSLDCIGGLKGSKLSTLNKHVKIWSVKYSGILSLRIFRLALTVSLINFIHEYSITHGGNSRFIRATCKCFHKLVLTTELFKYDTKVWSLLYENNQPLHLSWTTKKPLTNRSAYVVTVKQPLKQLPELVSNLR